jgi:hypothetical protein
MPLGRYQLMRTALRLGITEDLSVYEFLQELDRTTRIHAGRATLELSPDQFERLIYALVPALRWDRSVIPIINELNEGNPYWEEPLSDEPLAEKKRA